MKIIQKVSLLISCMSLCGALQSNVLLKDTLEQFLDRIEKDEKSKKGFRVYYSNFLEQQNKNYKSSKQKRLARLRASGLTTLRDNQPDWYKAIEPYSLDLDESTQECRQVRLFLTRYALFDAYKKGISVKIAGAREKVKNVLRPVKSCYLFVKGKVKSIFRKKS